MNPMFVEAASRLSDEELVKRVLSGDTSAFEWIVRRYNQRLFRTARAILRNDSDAEDVMQEAYVRAFVNLDQFAGRSTFATWLTKIAVYEALARLGRAKRQQELSETMDPAISPEHVAYSRQLKSAIESAVDALPANYRTVFVMREMENLSVAETADCLGISEDNVKTRAHRARSLLRARLECSIGAAGQAFAFMGRRCDCVTTRVMERIGAAALAGRLRTNPLDRHADQFHRVDRTMLIPASCRIE